MPTAWRIVKSKYAAAAFEGEGARLYGGRWTSVGRATVYTADSAALATLEILVHLQSSATLAYYCFASVTFPDSQVADVSVSALPANWRTSPGPAELQRIGDEWWERREFAVLRVPSAVIPISSNYLLNPAHPAFGTFSFGTPEPYAFDTRLNGAAVKH
ncbi:MAG: RES family NAD+ phosphorylase [Gemmatimonadales bacterium]